MTKRPAGARVPSASRSGSTGSPANRDEQRYRRGERRTAAEPLAAAWRPEPPARPAGGRRRPAPRRSGFGGLVSAYGWRVYAIPVLVVVTVLVVVNTAQRGSGQAGALPDAAAASGPAVATEQGAVPIDTGTGTAVLPPGDPFPAAGAGTWHTVSGNGPVVGKGSHLYHYEVAVEDGIDPAAYGGDDAFAKTVDAVLGDPRSWVAAGTIAVQRVDGSYQHPDFVVSLTTPNTDHRPDLCAFQIQYEASCWRSSAHRVVINLARWVRGALAFDGDLGLYRQYAINHEVGHVFGNQHVGCKVAGGLAPVMMQQTFGVADDYVWQLNQADPSNAMKVPRDGKVCKANAWPYPQGPSNPADAPPG